MPAGEVERLGDRTGLRPMSPILPSINRRKVKQVDADLDAFELITVTGVINPTMLRICCKITEPRAGKPSATFCSGHQSPPARRARRLATNIETAWATRDFVAQDQHDQT